MLLKPAKHTKAPRLLITVMGALGLFFTACTESEPPPPEPPLPANVSNLTDGETKTWVIAEVSMPDTTYQVNPDDCEGDNEHVFTYSNTDYLKENGSTKCNQGEPDQVNGSWELEEDEFLRIRDQDEVLLENYTLLTLTNNELRVSYEVDNPDGPGAVTREETWVPKSN